jgi:hypothetical protein
MSRKKTFEALSPLKLACPLDVTNSTASKPSHSVGSGPSQRNPETIVKWIHYHDCLPIKQESQNAVYKCSGYGMVSSRAKHKKRTRQTYHIAIEC